MTVTHKPRFVAYDELKTFYGETRSRTQLRRDIEAGDYPAPKQISAQRIAWESTSLDAYYDSRPTVAYAPAPRPPDPTVIGPAGGTTGRR